MAKKQITFMLDEDNCEVVKDMLERNPNRSMALNTLIRKGTQYNKLQQAPTNDEELDKYINILKKTTNKLCTLLTAYNIKLSDNLDVSFEDEEI